MDLMWFDIIKDSVFGEEWDRLSPSSQKTHQFIMNVPNVIAEVKGLYITYSLKWKGKTINARMTYKRLGNMSNAHIEYFIRGIDQTLSVCIACEHEDMGTKGDKIASFFVGIQNNQLEIIEVGIKLMDKYDMSMVVQLLTDRNKYYVAEDISMMMVPNRKQLVEEKILDPFISLWDLNETQIRDIWKQIIEGL